MRATFLPALLLLSFGCSACLSLAAAADTGTGPPAPLAPGQAPPLPKPSPLAAPRSKDQVGFPAALTASVIPPGSPLTPAAVALGEKLFFESRLSELVQKAGMIGMPVVVGISAPTALAVRVADAANITLIGIARDDGFEDFTHAERLSRH